MSFNLLEIFGAVLAGYLAKLVFPGLKRQFFATVFAYLLSPIAVFYAFQKNPFNSDFVSLGLIFFSLALLNLLFFSPLKRHFDREEKAFLNIACLMGNSGFLGIPLCIYFFGASAFAPAIIIDTVVGILAYSLGIYFLSRGKEGIRSALANVFKLPILYVIVLAIILEKNGFSASEPYLSYLGYGAKGGLLVGLSLIGMALATFKKTHFNARLLTTVSLIRFLLCPALAAVVIYFFPLPSLAKQILIFQSAMPMPIFTAVFSAYYDIAPKKGAMLVVLTTLLAVLFLPIWAYGLKFVFFK